MKPRIGIKSPYGGDVARNRRYARWCLYDSLTRGEAPYASHLLYTQVLDDNLPSYREMGISAREPHYDACETRAFYLDLDEGKYSSGMLRAKERAQKRWSAFWYLFRNAFRILFTMRIVERRLPTHFFAAFERGEEPFEGTK